MIKTRGVRDHIRERIARHLERIADHATNIAEDIIYLTSGEIIRRGKSI